MPHVYLDWNATTPPRLEVLEAMHAVAQTTWANPASVHRLGQVARAELDRTRRAVAELVGMEARDVVLTGGGTEANNLALRSLDGPVFVSRLEHPSIVRVAEALEREGRAVSWVDVRADGTIALDHLEKLLDASGNEGVVCLQAVNHETGVIQPVEGAAALAHRRGARLLCDAVQAAGRLEPEAWQGADIVTIAAHKLRGPKGIGAIASCAEVKLRPLLRGGDQERGLRPGTQDASLAAGFRVAAEHAKSGPARYRDLASLRDRLERELVAMAEAHGIEVARNGTGARAPHVANLSFAGWRGPELCAALDLEGVAASSGAACSAGTATPSPVISALAGVSRAESAVRLSLGDASTAKDIEAALAAFARVFRRRRPLETT